MSLVGSKFIFVVFLCELFLFSSTTVAEVTPVASPTAPQRLTLKDAVERAIKNNLGLQDQKLNLRLAEITHDNAWDTMYMPGVTLSLSSNSNATVAHLPGHTTDVVHGDADEHGYPTSTASLALGSYTLYNFGRDRLVYEQAKLDWLRAKELYIEAERALKFQVISAYWSLKSAMDQLEAADRSLNIARAIQELQESRLGIGKAAQKDVSSSEVDLLGAENLRETSESAVRNQLWSFNPTIGDPVGTQYIMDEAISFLPVSLTEDLVWETYLRESTTIKEGKKNIKKAEMALALEESNRLPLPKISFSGVVVNYTNSHYGNKPDFYTQSSGNTNLDVIAAVSLSLPLVGPGGLFGRRTVESSQIYLDQAQLRLRDSTNRDRAQILSLIQLIRQSEAVVVNDRQAFSKAEEVLESVLKQLSTESVSRLDLKDAINQAANSEIALSQAIQSHLGYKTQLAQLIGVDYLPRKE